MRNSWNGIGGADDQVVVGVEPGVEVERPEPAEPQQLRNDELDVGARCMVTGVEADDGAFAERGAVDERRAPVGDVGVVERGLEELVLEHQPLVVTQPCVDGGQCFGQPLLSSTDVVLTRIVGSVRPARS